MRISFRLRALGSTLFATAIATAMTVAVMPTADAQVWKPRNKPKPAAAVKKPSAKARPRPKKPVVAATPKPVAGNNGARPVDLVPDDDEPERDVRVVRDTPSPRSGGNDRRVGDTEVFVVIND